MLLCLLYAGVRDFDPSEVRKIVSNPEWFFKMSAATPLRSMDVVTEIHTACE